MARQPKTRPGETEYGGLSGPAGVPVRKTAKQLTPSERARLERIVGVPDASAPLNDRAWFGEKLEKTPRQQRGDRYSSP